MKNAGHWGKVFWSHYIMVSVTWSHKHMRSCSSGWGVWIVWIAIISIARCFLDWPWNPFVCRGFIISQAKWLAPCLSFITGRSSDKQADGRWGFFFPPSVKDQMVVGLTASEKAFCLSWWCGRQIGCSTARWAAEGNGEVPHQWQAADLQKRCPIRLCVGGDGRVTSCPPVLHVSSFNSLATMLIKYQLRLCWSLWEHVTICTVNELILWVHVTPGCVSSNDFVDTLYIL